MKVIYLDLVFFFLTTTLCSAGLLDEMEALDKGKYAAFYFIKILFSR